MNPDDPFFYPPKPKEYFERPSTASLGADLYGVKSAAWCPQCGQDNVVITLGASPDPYELPCEEFKFFTFFGITELADSVVKALQAINPNYGLRSDGFSDELCYLNACAACGYVFDEDNDLRVDPGDAFIPVLKADYEGIQLIPIDHRIGYELRLDEDEERTFDGLKAGCCNPAPDLYQVIFEQKEL